MVCVYKRKNYVIYSNREGFIIHNKNKEFKNGHTHIGNFNTAKYLIDLAIYSRIPNRESIYFIDSLIRISNDESYILRLKRVKTRIDSKKESFRYNCGKKHSTKVLSKKGRI